MAPRSWLVLRQPSTATRSITALVQKQKETHQHQVGLGHPSHRIFPAAWDQVPPQPWPSPGTQEASSIQAQSTSAASIPSPQLL